MEHDHTGEGEVPQQFFFLDASIEEMDNSTAHQYDMHGGSASAGSEEYHLTAQESPLPSSISGKKRARQKIFAHRGSAFKKEEDCVLCSAFLNVSKDPIKGVNKNKGGYYKRIYKYYHDHKPEGSVRSQISLQKRWATIEKAVTKFCSFKSAVDRKNESGKNEYDRIEDAVRMYEKTEPFHFMHCWEMLHNEAKWNDKLLKVRSTLIVAEGATAAASNPEHGNDSAGMHRGSASAGSEDGQTGEGEVPQHIFLDASIEEIDNSTAHQYNMHGGSASAGSEDYHLTAQESLLPSSMSGKKRAREKRVAHRGSAFKKEEDRILCSAFLNVSKKDPITGVNQNTDGYYKRIYDYYQDHKPEGSVRSQISLQKRWATIQKAVAKFCSFKSAVDRKNESGKNEHDRVEDALEMYEETEPFHFMHCWKMLHNEAKWNDKLLKVRSTPILAKGATAAASNPEHGNDSAGMHGGSASAGSEDGQTGEGEVPQHFFLDASIEEIDNNTAHQYDMHGGSASAGSEDYHLTAQESLLPSSISGKKRARQKIFARRGSAFKKEEDCVLCSAFLNVSKDPITGVNQNMDGYYKRIYDYYHDHKPEGSVRSQISLQKRWGVIQKAVAKFCSFKSAVDRKNESGKNEHDRVKDAVKMYEETEPFHFMHCWKILRNEAKWKDKLLEVRSTPILAKGATAAASNPEHGNDCAPVERPEGRDSTKIRRAREDTDSSSDEVEVLQEIHDRDENAEGKQDQQLQEILNMKADISQLSQKMFDLQKQDMEFRSKLKEEQLSINKQQLSLTKQDIEVRAKQSEAQLLTAEVGIMGADLEKLSPAVRSYYIMMQRQILVRRGVITPDNNDGA